MKAVFVCVVGDWKDGDEYIDSFATWFSRLPRTEQDKIPLLAAKILDHPHSAQEVWDTFIMAQEMKDTCVIHLIQNSLTGEETSSLSLLESEDKTDEASME